MSLSLLSLHVLVRKEQKWKWEKEQEEAFRKLKAVFIMKPVLAIPDIDRCYESPRKKRVSYAFKYLISNIKTYNGVKI